MESALIWLLKNWNGNAKLSVAFWGVLIPVLVGAQVFSHFGKPQMDNWPYLIGGAMVLMLLAKAYALVSVWRCAPNTSTSEKGTMYLARGFVLVMAVPMMLIFVLFTLEFFIT